MDMVEDSVACRLELAEKQDGCARPFGPHRDLSQDYQEATKGISEDDNRIKSKCTPGPNRRYYMLIIFQVKKTKHSKDQDG